VRESSEVDARPDGRGSERDPRGRLPGPPGLLGQGVRFALAGGTVSVVYLGTTTVLAELVGLPFQAALALGYGVALATHFTLQRKFVWVSDRDFVLPFSHQAARYLLVSGIQYGLTVLSTALLPAALGVATEVVYVLTVAVLVCVNFVIFRFGIFHSREDRTHVSPQAGPWPS
jgi:putative flippase GtrA